jgi:hypothetical protein
MGLKAYSGIGTVYMRPVTAAGVKTAEFKQIGTVEPMSIEIKNDQVKVKGRTVENSGQNIAAKNKLTDMTGKITLKEWNAANLAWALSGTYTSQVASGSTVTNEDVTAPTIAGDWIELAHRDVSSVVVTDAATDAITYSATTDYQIDAKLGLITTRTGSTITSAEALHVDYTYAAKTGYTVAIGASTQIRVEILAHLYNEYQDEHWVLELDSVILGANKEINFISSQDSEGEMLEFSMTPEILTGQSSCGRVNGISL